MSTAEHADDEDAAEEPLRSVHTTSFPQLLAEAGASVLATTYQAGKLVILRQQQGLLNTHFRNFNKPMGLAIDGGRLALGTAGEVWEFHNVPAVCDKLAAGAAASLPDACFLPRTCHYTGDVQIHEMAWVDGQLWFVNTAFSCLATRSHLNSFDPQWRPPFVPQLLPGDCCHLNGLAVRDGQVRYATALGTTGEVGGWQQNKRDGGVLLEVPSGEILLHGLSMPHSPRWYADRLWLLESGRGTLGVVDLQAGKYQPIVELPGFTRGLSFLGPFALVGLSQVRESAVFSGIPLVDRLQERTCGVWAVDLRSGQIAGFVRFEDAVQEIFAVEVLPGLRFPDLVNDDAELINRSYVLDDAALRDVPDELRSPS